MTDLIPPDGIRLVDQKMAIKRAIEILDEIYPARIAQQKATQAGRDKHLLWLLAALNTIDQADRGHDVRHEHHRPKTAR